MNACSLIAGVLSSCDSRRAPLSVSARDSNLLGVKKSTLVYARFQSRPRQRGKSEKEDIFSLIVSGLVSSAPFLGDSRLLVRSEVLCVFGWKPGGKALLSRSFK